jgi:hypothetical protein
MNTERELETLKTLALGKKRPSKAARFATDNVLLEKSPAAIEDYSDKENQSVSYNLGSGLGGISFTVE